MRGEVMIVTFSFIAVGALNYPLWRLPHHQGDAHDPGHDLDRPVSVITFFIHLSFAFAVSNMSGVFELRPLGSHVTFSMARVLLMIALS